MIEQSMVVFNQLGWSELFALFFVAVATIVGINQQRVKLSYSNEQRTSVKSYLIIVFYFLAAAGFIGLIVQPKFLVQQEIKIGLITSGNLSVNAGSPNNSKEIPIYSLSDDLTPAKSQESESESTQETRLLDETKLKIPQQVLIKHPDIKALKIFGDGLSQTEWRAFGNLEIDYHAPALINGLVDVKWNRRLNLGELMTVTGRFQFDQKTIATLQLVDPAGEIIVEKTLLGSEYFSISAQPKLVGRHQYQLNLLSIDKQWLNSEVISLEVTQQFNAKILVIQSAPSFEVKQLQNWAAQAGAKFMQITKVNPQTTITRKTNIFEDINSDISSQLFAQFDFLLIDGRGLLELNSYQQQSLIESVNDGLGVLVMVDESLLERYVAGGTLPAILTDFVTLERSTSKQQVPRWRDLYQSPDVLSELIIPTFGATIQIKSGHSQGISTLVTSESGNPLVVVKRKLLGRVGIATINQSYQWVTSGSKYLHAHYWQNLIAHIGRNYHSSMFVPETEGLKYFSKIRSDICVLTSLRAEHGFISPETALTKEQPLVFQPSKLVNNQYCASFWVNNAGWYLLRLNQPGSSEELSRWVYIEPSTAWLAEQQQAKISATLAKQSAFIKSNQIIDKQYREIDRWLYWWVLLLSMSSIWLLKKFD